MMKKWKGQYVIQEAGRLSQTSQEADKWRQKYNVKFCSIWAFESQENESSQCINYETLLFNYE